jgi:hypothetical protein
VSSFSGIPHFAGNAKEVNVTNPKQALQDLINQAAMKAVEEINPERIKHFLAGHPGDVIAIMKAVILRARSPNEDSEDQAVSNENLVSHTPTRWRGALRGFCVLHYLHMIESKDVFFMVISFCALWFTAFLCFVMYQVAGVIKRIHGLVDDVRSKVSELMEMVSGIRMRVEGHVSALGSVSDGIRKIMEMLRNRD